MRSFTDAQGREWQIDVTLGTIKQVRIATGYSLPSMFDTDESLSQFVADYEKIGDTLFELCKGQHGDVDPVQFARALGGDALREATEALVRATVDFFPTPEAREVQHKRIDTLLEVTRKVSAIGLAIVTEQLAKIDTDRLAKEYLSFVTSGQGNAASTQTTAQPANCT